MWGSIKNNNFYITLLSPNMYIKNGTGRWKIFTKKYTKYVGKVSLGGI